MLVQWEDNNADGVPSVGDLIRTGQFPELVSSTTWDLVPARVTEFPVTAVNWSASEIFAFSGSLRRFVIQGGSSQESYTEFYIADPSAPLGPTRPVFRFDGP